MNPRKRYFIRVGLLKGKECTAKPILVISKNGRERTKALVTLTKDTTQSFEFEYFHLISKAKALTTQLSLSF